MRLLTYRSKKIRLKCYNIILKSFEQALKYALKMQKIKNIKLKNKKNE